MNCLDYRRMLMGGEPEREAMRVHRLECAACGQLHEEHAAFEEELRRGLQVPVRPGFAEELARPLGARRRRFLAAAGVAALAGGIGAYAWLRRDDPLALACIQFVMKEEAKSIMMGPMPRAEAEKALAGVLPLARIEQLGRIRHVGPCPFNGIMAYHVVLAVPQGIVTLLVMPALDAGGARATHEGLYARVVALKGGSVGIIGADPAVVESVAGAVRA